MELAKRIFEEVSKLPIEMQEEILDFIEFKKIREQKVVNEVIECVLEENKEAFKELAKRLKH